jgi:hypothetical protein
MRLIDIVHNLPPKPSFKQTFDKITVISLSHISLIPKEIFILSNLIQEPIVNSQRMPEANGQQEIPVGPNACLIDFVGPFGGDCHHDFFLFVGFVLARLWDLFGVGLEDCPEVGAGPGRHCRVSHPVLLPLPLPIPLFLPIAIPITGLSVVPLAGSPLPLGNIHLANLKAQLHADILAVSFLGAELLEQALQQAVGPGPHDLLLADDLLEGGHEP